MNDPLLVLVPTSSHIDVFGPTDDALFARLARARSWSEAHALLALLPTHRRRTTIVAVGVTPPDSFLRLLAPPTDGLVFVPSPWLADAPRRYPTVRARRAASLAALHLAAPIQTHPVLTDDDLPF